MYSLVSWDIEALGLRSYLPMKIMSPQMSRTKTHTNIFLTSQAVEQPNVIYVVLRLLNFALFSALLSLEITFIKIIHIVSFKLLKDNLQYN